MILLDLGRLLSDFRRFELTTLVDRSRTPTESESLTTVHWRCPLWMEISSSNTEMTLAGCGTSAVLTMADLLRETDRSQESPES